MADDAPSLAQLLFNAEEAIKILGVTKRQLYHLVKRGLLKKHPAFRYLVFRKDDLDAFVTMS